MHPQVRNTTVWTLRKWKRELEYAQEGYDYWVKQLLNECGGRLCQLDGVKVEEHTTEPDMNWEAIVHAIEDVLDYDWDQYLAEHGDDLQPAKYWIRPETSTVVTVEPLPATELE